MASKGVSISEACRQLGVSANALRAMMADGRLRYRRVNNGLGKPGHIVIRASDIAALLPPLSQQRPDVPALAQTTLQNSRMRNVVKAVRNKEKRAEFLRSWTGQDLRAPLPVNDAAPGTFSRRCRHSGSQ